MKYDVVIVGGFGHVGLPLGISLADRGKRVCAVDVNAAVQERIGRGEMPFSDEGAESALRRVLGTGRLTLSRMTCSGCLCGTPWSSWSERRWTGI